MSRSLNLVALGAAVLVGTGVLAVFVADGMVSRPQEALRAEMAERNESARAWAVGRQAELDAARAATEADASAADAGAGDQAAEPTTEQTVEAGAVATAEPTVEAATEGTGAAATETTAEASADATDAGGTDEAQRVATEDTDAATPETSAVQSETDDAAAEAQPVATEDTDAATPEATAAQSETDGAASDARPVAAVGTPSTGPYALGRLATGDEIAAWDIDVRPDGQGLPEGSGSVADGEAIYQERCAACHGTFGEAIGRWPVLAGGEGTLKADRPNKTIGSYWPYASTIFDYIHRAMPFGAGQSLTDDETFAVTAYLLSLNFLVDDDFVLSRETFADVAELPNADAFFMDDRAETELATFVSTDACMENCKPEVRITGRAAVLDVTPEAGGADLEGGGGTSDVAQAERPTAPEATETAQAGETGTAAEAGETGTAAEAGDTGTAAEAGETPASGTGDAPEAAGPDPALVATGEALFRQCSSCHQIGEGAKNRVGPQLNGVVGREIGALEDFKYSKVFEEAHAAGEVWTDEALLAFLKDPRGAMKGTKMSFRGLKDDADAAAIVAYLAAAGG